RTSPASGGRRDRAPSLAAGGGLIRRELRRRPREPRGGGQCTASGRVVTPAVPARLHCDNRGVAGGVAMENEPTGAVYVQTNDAVKNEVVGYRRAADGSLTQSGTFETGGRGTGERHLPSQSSLVVAGGYLLVANAGSDDVSLFAVEDDGLRLADTAPSGGSRPTSIAVRDGLVYVLNNGSATIDGLRVAGEKLEAIR